MQAVKIFLTEQYIVAMTFTTTWYLFYNNVVLLIKIKTAQFCDSTAIYVFSREPQKPHFVSLKHLFQKYLYAIDLCLLIE